MEHSALECLERPKKKKTRVKKTKTTLVLEEATEDYDSKHDKWRTWQPAVIPVTQRKREKSSLKSVPQPETRFKIRDLRSRSDKAKYLLNQDKEIDMDSKFHDPNTESQIHAWDQSQ